MCLVIWLVSCFYKLIDIRGVFTTLSNITIKLFSKNVEKLGVNYRPEKHSEFLRNIL